MEKGRGAQINPHNKFAKEEIVVEEAFKEFCRLNNEKWKNAKTDYINVEPKTIITKVDSPDVPFNYSINPYQGCEHGCVYCYARNSHQYWGYGSGLDFEKKILVKRNAAHLLRNELEKKNWKAALVMLSGNTDCYQPIERKLKITRSLLEVFEEKKHPVGIITKNSLIKRDIDLLSSLNDQNLLRVTLSITSLKEETRRLLEPRTASVKQRLKTLEELSKAGIKVNVNMAPIIPGLNSEEILELAKTVSEYGAHSIAYIMLRLNGQIGSIFTDWVQKAMPLKANRILHLIRDTRSGKLNESRWNKRMKGEGAFAEHVSGLFKIARQKYFQNTERQPINFDVFEKKSQSQLKLF
ncbi:MAG: PA0069 family radical SAM protein [Bacteroidota bacterium]